MNLKPALLTATLLAALLSGCAEEKDADPNAAEVPSDPVSQALGDAVVAAPLLEDENATLSVDTPFLLPATTGPDAPITAYKWRIPKGAILEYNPIPGFDFTIEEINFEMVPVFTNGAKPTEFAVLFVSLEDEAYVIGSYIGVSLQGEYSSTLVMSSPIEYVPELQSRYISLYAGELETGDEIGIVVIGKSEAAGDFGLLFGPLTEEVDYSDDPPETADDLLEGRSAATLVPSGTGAGFGYSYYVNQNLVFATSVTHYEIRAGEVQVEDRTRTPTEPVATVRESTVSAAYDGGGYGSGFVYMYASDLLTPNCVAGGTFDIGMDVHGATVDFRSIVLEAPQAYMASLVTGSAIATAVGESSSGSASSLTFQVAQSCSFEIINLRQMDVGAGMADLFGVAAATGAAEFSGIAGNLPPMMWRQGDDLVLLDAGGLTTLDGQGFLLETLA